MIVVLGRPGLDSRGRLDRTAGRVAAAAASAGGQVELVGSIGDDPDGDALAVALGQAGVGHAALLREPGAVTPRRVSDDEDTPATDSATAALPRLEAADVELGLRYLIECRVLVIAEDLAPAALAAALDGAAYHAAHVVLLRPAATDATEVELPTDTTVLEMPVDDVGAFTLLVGRYAARLDGGIAPAEAWPAAVGETGWESVTE